MAGGVFRGMGGYTALPKEDSDEESFSPKVSVVARRSINDDVDQDVVSSSEVKIDSDHTLSEGKKSHPVAWEARQERCLELLKQFPLKDKSVPTGTRLIDLLEQRELYSWEKREELIPIQKGIWRIHCAKDRLDLLRECASWNKEEATAILEKYSQPINDLTSRYPREFYDFLNEYSGSHSDDFQFGLNLLREVKQDEYFGGNRYYEWMMRYFLFFYTGLEKYKEMIESAKVEFPDGKVDEAIVYSCCDEVDDFIQKHRPLCVIA